MEGQPCTCGGENPRCFKCDGTGFMDPPEPAGYLGDRLGLMRSAQGARVHAEGRMLAMCQCRGETLDCPSGCSFGFLVVPRPIDEHITPPTPDSRTGRSSLREQASSANSVAFAHCPICAERMHYADLAIHITDSHRRAVFKPTTRTVIDLQSVWRCPECGLKTSRVEHHLNKKHGGAACCLKCRCRVSVAALDSHYRRLHGGAAIAAERRRPEQVPVDGVAKLSQRSAWLNKQLQAAHHGRWDGAACAGCLAVLPNEAALAAHLPSCSSVRRIGEFEPEASPKRSKRQRSTTDHPRTAHRTFSSAATAPVEEITDIAEAEGDLEAETHETLERSDCTLDATFGMGSFARDHGAFGSHSAYDAMDDESDA